MTFVLVVEDEGSISDALAYMLRKEGFEVAVCPTGPDAVAAFDRNGADLCAARHRHHRARRMLKALPLGPDNCLTALPVRAHPRT